MVSVNSWNNTQYAGEKLFILLVNFSASSSPKKQKRRSPEPPQVVKETTPPPGKSFYPREVLLSFLYYLTHVVCAGDNGLAFVSMEHSYCLPHSENIENQENIEDRGKIEEEKITASSYLDHDYAGSPYSPIVQQPSPKKAPLKDRNRIVNNRKQDRDLAAKK